MNGETVYCYHFGANLRRWLSRIHFFSPDRSFTADGDLLWPTGCVKTTHHMTCFRDVQQAIIMTTVWIDDDKMKSDYNMKKNWKYVRGDTERWNVRHQWQRDNQDQHSAHETRHLTSECARSLLVGSCCRYLHSLPHRVTQVVRGFALISSMHEVGVTLRLWALHSIQLFFSHYFNLPQFLLSFHFQEDIVTLCIQSTRSWGVRTNPSSSQFLSEKIESQQEELHRVQAGEFHRRDQQLLHEQLLKQNWDLREAHEGSVKEMEELEKFQSSTFDTIARRRLVEAQDTTWELTGRIQDLQNEINCMNDSRDFQDAESIRIGNSHVASQPVSFPPHPIPGGMQSRSIGMPSRRGGPPSVWDTHGTSRNVFANPIASSSAP